MEVKPMNKQILIELDPPQPLPIPSPLRPFPSPTPHIPVDPNPQLTSF